MGSKHDRETKLGAQWMKERRVASPKPNPQRPVEAVDIVVRSVVSSLNIGAYL